MSDGIPRKVAICGTAPSSYPLAPYNDPEWEIWGTSRLYEAIPRWDVWFELHPLDRIGKGWTCSEDERKLQRQQHLDWMAKQEFPIYLQEEDPRIPSGLKYPLDRVLTYLDEEFNAPEAYLTNHMAYMLALAIYERVDVIGLWGVDMALNSEYAYQRPSCEYLIGIARGAGIEVVVPKECDLLKAMHLYGYEDDTAFHAKIRARMKELRARQEQAKSQKQETLQRRAALAGRIGLIEDLCANGIPEDMKQELVAHGEEAAAKAQELEQSVAHLNSEIQVYKGALDNMEYVERSWV